MESFRQDVRLAIRLLRKQPGFSLLAIGTLAVGIGLSTALFSVLDAAFIRPLPYPQPEQLVEISIGHTRENGEVSYYAPSLDDLRDFEGHGGVFSHVAASRSAFFRPLILDGDEPLRLLAERVTRDYFPLYGVRPLLGRAFTDDEYARSAEDVVLIGYDLWRSRFGADRNVVNTTVRLNGQPAVIIGVMPEAFYRETTLWQPFDLANDGFARQRGSGADVDGRLRSGVSIAEAEASLSALVQRAVQERGGESGNVRLRSKYEEATRANVSTARAISYGVGIVILLACVNVSGLLLARGAARRAEIAVRASLGATRPRLARQLLIESLVLAVAGGGLGVFLAWVSLDVLAANVPMTLPDNAVVALEWRALGFAAAAALATSVMFGMLPAWRLSGTTGLAALAGTSRRSGSVLSRRGGQALIVAEVALAVVLLAGAGLTVRSLLRLTSVDLGFDPRPLLAIEITPALPGAAHAEFFPPLIDRLASHPGTAAASAVTSVPLLAAGVLAVGSVEVPGGPAVQIEIRRYLGDYFNTVGIPVIEGRPPLRATPDGGVLQVVINEAARKALFANAPAAGARLQRASARGWQALEVAAVVADVRHAGPRGVARPAMWQVFKPSEDRNSLIVLARRKESKGISATDARQAVTSFGKAAVIDKISFGSSWLGERVAAPRRRAVLFGLLGSFGFLLALVGIFGVTAYAVSRRTQEIGVRMAFGASHRSVVSAMLRDSAWPVAIGVAAGLLASWWATSIIRTFLFETEPRDAATFAIVAGMLAVAALVAAWIPARRAARVDPIVALRAE